MDDSHAGARLTPTSLFPMDPMEMSCFDIRAAHVPSPKSSHDSNAAKRKGSSSPRQISLATYNTNAYWIAAGPQARKRGRLQQHSKKEPQLELQMHQSTCLNLDPDANTAESDLWILPDFDDWEVENETQPQDYQSAVTKTSGWAPLVKRAASSNRERLRRRLEGDGWDFVGGKYGEDGVALKEVADANEERVDEEFDLVVLPVVHISC